MAETSTNPGSDGATLLADDWIAIAGNPKTWLDEAHIAQVLAADESHTRDMLKQPRFKERILKRIRLHYELPELDPSNVTDEDSRVVTAYAVDAERLIRLCGVLAHANTLKNEIRASRILGLREHIDETLWHQALAHSDAAIEPAADTADVGTFTRDIRARGVDCLIGWLHQCPAPLADWLEMTMADALRLGGCNPAPRHLEHGPAIARLAATLISSTTSGTAPSEADD